MRLGQADLNCRNSIGVADGADSPRHHRNTAGGPPEIAEVLSRSDNIDRLSYRGRRRFRMGWGIDRRHSIDLAGRLDIAAVSLRWENSGRECRGRIRYRTAGPG